MLLYKLPRDLVAKTLSVSEARKHLPALLDEVSRTGQPLTITRRGQPIARIMPCLPDDDRLKYPLRGLGIWVSDDFDEPMDEIWEGLDEDWSS
jgi:prevent-host-death family protein